MTMAVSDTNSAWIDAPALPHLDSKDAYDRLVLVSMHKG